ncbi:short-chain dehydrogenase reductase sdr [Lecanosticta acicola]|uniref:Short-chain dehydrogenase reductase sdr n=1 Tax=Lecanosticta acicola TaxID=111012 RepID=A0AAI8Z4A6_9PEZI|nr:short-chain dehydrogenase reductase sdr [Lecanosticta acicola]
MSLSIDGVAVVTGAGSGIGKECALAYAAEGARGVVVVDLNAEAATKTALQCDSIATNPNYKSHAVACDVANPSSVELMVASAVDQFSRIDYCVNSAGVGVQKHLPVSDAEAEEMDRFWKVNVMGTFNILQAVSKVMKKQDTVITASRGRVRDVGKGVFVNLGSANSYMATPDIVQYTTSKHAIIGLTKSAALDLAKEGIRVNAICPGWVATPMVQAAMEDNDRLEPMINSAVPMSRIAQPEEIADVVLFMTSPRSSYVTGSAWIVDGGTTLTLKAV